MESKKNPNGLGRVFDFQVDDSKDLLKTLPIGRTGRDSIEVRLTDVPSVLSYLRTVFPDRSPVLEDPERVVWFKAGQVSVATHLEQLWAEQSAIKPDERIIGK